MKIAEARTIKLRALTPIFCGNGETLDPLSYVLDGPVIRVINPDRFFDGLSEEQIKAYQEWLEPLIERRAKQDISLERFLTNKLRVKSSQFLAASTAYVVGFSVRPDQNGFKLHVRDFQARPYLPGSEIKGAIRTALLHTLLDEENNYNGYCQQLDYLLSDAERNYEERRRKGRETTLEKEIGFLLNKFSDKLETRLLRGEVKGKFENDAKYDSLRLLQVSDSESLSPTMMKIELTQSLGTSRNTRTWIETMQTGTEWACGLTLYDSQLVAKKMGFDRLSRYFKLENLLKACHQHSAAILEEEAEYFRGNQKISSIIGQLTSMNQPQSPLLRIGGGQGFLSLTVNLPLKNDDYDLYEDAIRVGASNLPRRRWRTYENNFPKTRRVITDQQGNPAGLLGWVRLQVAVRGA